MRVRDKLIARRMLEIEGISNRYFIHPIGLYFTQLLYPTFITPNQLSVLACFFGILAAFSFYHYNSSAWFSLLGLIFAIVRLILDGMDGQLARLRNTASAYGMMVDGICDHISETFIYLIFIIKLWNVPAIILISLAGVSHFIQAVTYELQRAVYEFWVKGGENNKLPKATGALGSNKIFNTLKNIYSFFQIKFSGIELGLLNVMKREETAEIAIYYQKKFSRLIQVWSIMSDNYRYLVLYLVCLIQSPILFFILEFTLWNGLNFLLVLVYKKKQRAFKNYLLKG